MCPFYAKPFLFYHIFESVLKSNAIISAVLFLFDITLSIRDFFVVLCILCEGVSFSINICIVVTLNLQIILGNMEILTILIYLVNKHKLSSYFHVCSSVVLDTHLFN